MSNKRQKCKRQGSKGVDKKFPSQFGSNENVLQCSKSCGTGHQRRRVECTMRRGNHGPEVTVKDEQCSRLGLRKPRSQRPCRRFACNFIWQEGPWSEVSSYLAAMIYDLSIMFYTIACLLFISIHFQYSDFVLVGSSRSSLPMDFMNEIKLQYFSCVQTIH